MLLCIALTFLSNSPIAGGLITSKLCIGVIGGVGAMALLVEAFALRRKPKMKIK
jgi:hypothetical protein